MSGAGAARGGCIAYLVDKCANNLTRSETNNEEIEMLPTERRTVARAFLLSFLGHQQNINGVGRDTEPLAANFTYHVYHTLAPL